MKGLVAVVGSRSLPASWAGTVSQVVSSLLARGCSVGSGGALGADLLALQAVVAAGPSACSGSRVFLPGRVWSGSGGFSRCSAGFCGSGRGSRCRSCSGRCGAGSVRSGPVRPFAGARCCVLRSSSLSFPGRRGAPGSRCAKRYSAVSRLSCSRLRAGVRSRRSVAAAGWLFPAGRGRFAGCRLPRPASGASTGCRPAAARLALLLISNHWGGNSPFFQTLMAYRFDFSL